MPVNLHPIIHLDPLVEGDNTLEILSDREGVFTSVREILPDGTRGPELIGTDLPEPGPSVIQFDWKGEFVRLGDEALETATD